VTKRGHAARSQLRQHEPDSTCKLKDEIFQKKDSLKEVIFQKKNKNLNLNLNLKLAI